MTPNRPFTDDCTDAELLARAWCVFTGWPDAKRRDRLEAWQAEMDAETESEELEDALREVETERTMRLIDEHTAKVVEQYPEAVAKAHAYIKMFFKRKAEEGGGA